jgi:hypothetical protein
VYTSGVQTHPERIAASASVSRRIGWSSSANSLKRTWKLRQGARIYSVQRKKIRTKTIFSGCLPPQTDPEVEWGPILAVYKLHTLLICLGKVGAGAFDVDEVLRQARA